LFGASLVGCSAGGSSGVNLANRTTREVHSQSFGTGVADVRDSGETDVVVSARTESNTPGTPSVTQVLHLRVLWQQGFVVKAADRDASQNAAVHWYVYPDGAAASGARPQLAEYSGTAHVDLDSSGDKVRVKIRQADLRPIMVTSQMSDPIGPSTFTGTLVAERDRAATATVIGELNATTAAARANTGRIVEAQLPFRE
jgi:hypothetical protein